MAVLEDKGRIPARVAGGAGETAAGGMALALHGAVIPVQVPGTTQEPRETQQESALSTEQE